MSRECEQPVESRKRQENGFSSRATCKHLKFRPVILMSDF